MITKAFQFTQLCHNSRIDTVTRENDLLRLRVFKDLAMLINNYKLEIVLPTKHSIFAKSIMVEAEQNLLECAEEILDPNLVEHNHNQSDDYMVPPMLLDDYKNFLQIGKGAYGEVYKAASKSNGELFAIKVCRLDASSSGLSSNIYKEIQALKTLEHPNLVHFVNYMLNIDFPYVYVCLIQECCDFDLKSYIDSM